MRHAPPPPPRHPRHSGNNGEGRGGGGGQSPEMEGAGRPWCCAPGHRLQADTPRNTHRGLPGAGLQMVSKAELNVPGIDNAMTPEFYYVTVPVLPPCVRRALPPKCTVVFGLMRSSLVLPYICCTLEPFSSVGLFPCSLDLAWTLLGPWRTYQSEVSPSLYLHQAGPIRPVLFLTVVGPSADKPSGLRVA